MPCMRALLFILAVVLALTLAACGNNGGGGAGPPEHANDMDSGPAGGGADVTTGADGSGVAPGGGDSVLADAGAVASDAGGIGVEGGSTPTEAGTVPTDDAGGVQTEGGTEGGSGVRDVGSCCMEQTTPGCSNAGLEVCVCEKDPTCCTTAWTAPCVLIVQQKYCQPGVRDCVCGSDAGQWNQADCCNTDWTSTCDSVATIKCNAVQGCF